MKTPTITSERPECSCMHNYDSNGRDPNCPLHERSSESKCLKCGHEPHEANNCETGVVDAAGDVDYCPCQSGLDLKTVRELKNQLVSKSVCPAQPNGVFFMVTTKENVCRVLKSLGFTQKEIRKIMKRVEKNNDRPRQRKVLATKTSH